MHDDEVSLVLMLALVIVAAAIALAFVSYEAGEGNGYKACKQEDVEVAK